MKSRSHDIAETSTIAEHPHGPGSTMLPQLISAKPTNRVITIVTSSIWCHARAVYLTQPLTAVVKCTCGYTPLGANVVFASIAKPSVSSADASSAAINRNPAAPCWSHESLVCVLAVLETFASVTQI